MFGKLEQENDGDETNIAKTCKYYERAIISTLQLIIKHKSNLLANVYSNNLTVQPPNAISIDDIIIHYVLWHTAKQLTPDSFDYAAVAKKITTEAGENGEDILRGLLNFDNVVERYKLLEKCKAENKLFPVVKVFYESLKEPNIMEAKQDQDRVTSIKNHIKEYLRIIVSDQCNLSCVYCHREGRHDSLNGSIIKSNQDFDLRQVLQIAKECNFKKIKLSGGEPLLYPNILQICNEFQDNFEDIGFTTNGTRLTALKEQLEMIKGGHLTFNVTLNSLNPEKYSKITGNSGTPDIVKDGIDLLKKCGIKLKINAVITSYNFDDIYDLVTYAAISNIDIKLLDLFSVANIPLSFQRVSIAEIKNKVMDLFKISNEDFYDYNDYICANKMGIRILIPQRIYSADCQYNCPLYPCAEGLFGIRVYEDYSCARCFKGEMLQGDLPALKNNIATIRRDLDSARILF